MRRLLCSIVVAGGLLTASGSRAETDGTPVATPTPEQAAAVKRALPSDTPDISPFLVAQVDLTDNGLPDLIVKTANPKLCTNLGCNTYVLLATPSGYSPKIMDLGVISHGQVTVLDSRRFGMRDLRFDNSDHVFRWTGKQYR